MLCLLVGFLWKNYSRKIKYDRFYTPVKFGEEKKSIYGHKSQPHVQPISLKTLTDWVWKKKKSKPKINVNKAKGVRGCCGIHAVQVHAPRMCGSDFNAEWNERKKHKTQTEIWWMIFFPSFFVGFPIFSSFFTRFPGSLHINKYAHLKPIHFITGVHTHPSI